MNILHELIKDKFEALSFVYNEDISVGLAEELQEMIHIELNDTTCEDYDYMEWNGMNEVIFVFIASFNDMPSNWSHEKSCFAYISFHKDTNFEKPYIDRDWN